MKFLLEIVFGFGALMTLAAAFLLGFAVYTVIQDDYNKYLVIIGAPLFVVGILIMITLRSYAKGGIDQLIQGIFWNI